MIPNNNYYTPAPRFPNNPPPQRARVPVYYGYEEISLICSRFICETFNCPAGIVVPESSANLQPPSNGEITPSLAEFVAYAIHRTRLDEAVIYTALGILHRMKNYYPAASSSGGHRLFLTAFMIASKTICDDTFSNKSWVTVGQGLFALRELNQMEREMCGYLEFKFNIPREDLTRFKTQVYQIYSRPPPYRSAVTVVLNRGVGNKPLPSMSM